MIEVYPDEAMKPELGCKLNKCAIVNLEGGMKPKNGMNAHEYEQQLKKKVEQNGGEHLSYDIEGFSWMFRVPHF